MAEPVAAPLPKFGPDWEAAREYGIDLWQTLHNLSLTPTERVLQLQAALDLAVELKHAGERAERVVR